MSSEIIFDTRKKEETYEAQVLCSCCEEEIRYWSQYVLWVAQGESSVQQLRYVPANIVACTSYNLALLKLYTIMIYWLIMWSSGTKNKLKKAYNVTNERWGPVKIEQS